MQAPPFSLRLDVNVREHIILIWILILIANPRKRVLES